MKTIRKINKYLVEHYPLIWNTRLVWMLLTALSIHVLFFFIGFFFVNAQKDLEEHYRLSEFYYNTPAFLCGVLISIIVLLIWIIYYLQNNAFKNFYPLKKGTLFLQFCILVSIVFLNITQYYSFQSGLKTKIKSLYKWEEVDKDIKAINKLSIFFLEDESNYRISYKAYPPPFPLEIASAEKREWLAYQIDTTKAYFKFDESYYQFYKLDRKQIKIDSIKAGVDYRNLDRTGFKYRIVYDMSKFKKHVIPNLYNYSKELYSYGQDSIASKNRIKWYEEVLNKKDTKEIEKHLRDFLALAKKYGFQHNLTIKDWLHLINMKNEYQFLIKIQDRRPEVYEYEKERLLETYKKENIDKVPYLNLGGINYYFKNVYETYNPKEHTETFYISIVLSFIVALLLFLFKVTDIKTLLLSVVAGCILLITIVLSNVIISRYELGLARYYNELISFGILFLVLGFSMMSLIMQWKKIVSGILFSLAVFIIPLLVVLPILAYKSYLRYAELESYNFLNWYNTHGFTCTMLIWLLGIGLYTIAIRKWRGLPEK